MKANILSIAISAILTLTAVASDSLPFGVSLAGQAAKDGTPFASIEKPVAANAELIVNGKADIIIVNVSPADAKGNPKEGATPAVIILQGTNKNHTRQEAGRTETRRREVLHERGDGRENSDPEI